MAPKINTKTAVHHVGLVSVRAKEHKAVTKPKTKYTNIYSEAKNTTSPIKINPSNTPIYSTYEKSKGNKEFTNEEAKRIKQATGMSYGAVKDLGHNESYSSRTYDDFKHKSRGFGTLTTSNKPITRQEAVNAVIKHIKGNSKIYEKKLPQNTPKQIKDVLRNTAYNLGPNGLKDSKLIKHVEKKEYKKMFEDMNVVKSGGKISLGLCIREMQNICRANDAVHAKEALQQIKQITKWGLSACKSAKDKKDFLKAAKTIETICLNQNKSINNKTKVKEEIAKTGTKKADPYAYAKAKLTKLFAQNQTQPKTEKRKIIRWD